MSCDQYFSYIDYCKTEVISISAILIIVKCQVSSISAILVIVKRQFSGITTKLIIVKRQEKKVFQLY